MKKSKVNIDRASILYEGGMTLKQVADKLGTSQPNLSHLFTRHGIETRKLGRPKGSRAGPNKGSKLDLQIVKNLYESGLSLSEIGDIFGCSRQAVQQLLKYYGIKRRSSGAR